MIITTLDSFPAGDNPFKHDMYHMGTYLGGSGHDMDVCIMFAKHEHNDYIIVVDTVTGQRIKINFDRPKEE